MAALLQFVLAVSDDQFVRGNAARDLAQIALRNRNGHIANFHGLVRLHHVDVVSLRSTLHRGRWNHRHVLLRFQQQDEYSRTG